MLTIYVTSELQQWNAISVVVWMDSHVESIVKRLLTQELGDRMIFCHCMHFSPPVDFWQWGYLKSKVYAFSKQIVSDFKDAIIRVVQQISFSTVHASVLSTICWIKCLYMQWQASWKCVKHKKCFAFLSLFYICSFHRFLSAFFLVSELFELHVPFLCHSWFLMAVRN